MADMMPKKSYDLKEITRLLLEMRENCIPKSGNAYEDPNRAEKYDALNAAIDLINNPSMLTKWISVEERLPELNVEVLGWYKDNPFSAYRRGVVSWNGKGGYLFMHADTSPMSRIGWSCRSRRRRKENEKVRADF